MGQSLYKGFSGGLYPEGKNLRPAAHEAAGLDRARAVQPLNQAGDPDPAGRIVFVSIGMSNTTQEFSVFKPLADADPAKNPLLTIVDGAQGGMTASRIVDFSQPAAQQFWDTLEARLEAAGVTPAQVQIAWVKEAEAGPTQAFPEDARKLQSALAALVRLMNSRFPNLRLAYLSSRIYAGYATTALNPEPFAYQSGFAVKWLIEDQINGVMDLNYDPSRGSVQAPWLAWGPYLWADGLNPRADGLTYACSDFATDGTHPSTTARRKVADQLLSFLKTDTTARLWFLASSQPQFAIELPVHPADAVHNAFGIWPFGVHGLSHDVSGHTGLDFECRPGATALAAADGEIETIAADPDFSSRRSVSILHTFGASVFRTVYRNLATVASNLQPGATVNSGQALGVVDTSGATPAFLHLQLELTGPAVRDRSGCDSKVNPAAYFSPSANADFALLWKSASYQQQLAEPFSSNLPAVTFPLARSWHRLGDGTPARIDFVRSSGTGQYAYTFYDSAGKVTETGTVARFAPGYPTGEIDLTPDGQGTIRLGLLSVDDRTLRMAWGASRPADLAGAHIFQTGADRQAFAVGARGAFSMSTTGAPARPVSGYAVISPDDGPAPGGMAILQLRQKGVAVSENSFQAVPARTAWWTYAENRENVRTGLALVNPNAQPTDVNVGLVTDSSQIAYRSISLQAGAQLVAFLDQSPFDFGSSFVGALRVTSGLPVAVSAIRGLSNERSEFLVTTLPAFEPTLSNGPGSFPHFCAGEGWTMEIVLVNPSAQALAGTIDFFSPAGSQSGLLAQVGYAVPTRSARTYPSPAPPAGQLWSGSIRVTPRPSMTLPVGFAVYSNRKGGITVSEFSAPLGTPATAVRFFAESSGNVQTAIAVANPGAAAVQVRCELSALDGAPLGAGTLAVPAGGQVARFLTEIDGLKTLVLPITGLLRVAVVDQGQISVLALRTRLNERQDLLVAITPPIEESESTATGPLLIPDFADGGGYISQFLLLPRSSQARASGVMQFLGASGQPWPILSP